MTDFTAMWLLLTLFYLAGLLSFINIENLINKKFNNLTDQLIYLEKIIKDKKI